MTEQQNNYRTFLEIMKIEFGDFLRLAESGRVVRHAALKARKKSIKLRDLLKNFRDVSLENDRKIGEIMTAAKIRIEQELSTMDNVVETIDIQD